MRAAERDAAKKLGLKRYFTGNPCGVGHIAERYTSSAACVICVKGKKTPEETRAYLLGWQRANRDKTKQYTLRHKMKKFGSSVEELDAVTARQNGVCAICEKPSKLVIDHDHATGAFRGLLCNGCNGALGVFCDDIATLERAIKYLKRSLSSTE